MAVERDEGIEIIAKSLLDAAFAVHSALGPGLLESVYELCLLHELTLRGVKASRQVVLPVSYRGLELDAAFRLDLLVEGSIVVEVKAVDCLTSTHEAQLLTGYPENAWVSC